MGLRLFFFFLWSRARAFFCSFLFCVLEEGGRVDLCGDVVWYFYVEAFFFIAVECISGWLFMV